MKLVFRTLFALLLLMVGCGRSDLLPRAVGVGGEGAGGTGPAARGGSGGSALPAWAWQTETVSLTANDFWIIADGRRFVGDSGGIAVTSDAGSSTYTTLELIWKENSVEMRFNLYFRADRTNWWSDELRTYNGQAIADWLFYKGRFFSSPLGATYRGDVDLTNDSSDQLRGEIHLRGLALSTTLSGG